MSAVTDNSEVLLEATALYKSFEGIDVLRDVHLRMIRGEVLAVVGPSGSGKSTLLHCLAGIIQPSEGDVRFRGQLLRCLSDNELSAMRRRDFGFVFQFGQLVAELTAEENVALPLLLDRTRTRKQVMSAARSRLHSLGLAGFERRRPGQLSGGQAQRVAIARALIVEPSVIFADEPTGSLDTETGDTVIDALTTAAREQATAVVIVTHNARVAAQADRTITMRDGKMLASSAAST